MIEGGLRTDLPCPLDALATEVAARFHPETEETLLSLMVELVPEVADRLASRLIVSEELEVRPAMPAECILDRNALIMGYSGVYSSFLKHAVRQAERYGVPAHELLHRAGQRKLIGGQEDQLIDIALEVKREQAAAR